MTGRETVVNKALSGAEIKNLLRRDFERLLANEGLLSDHIAYGRIGWDFRLRLHMTNWLVPESESTLSSRTPGRNLIDADPSLAAIETPPLKLAPDEPSVVTASELSHSIDSPNLERVTAGIPVPVVIRQHDGTTSEQKVSYPAPDPSQHAHPAVTITDVSEEARRDWNIKAPAAAPATIPAK